MFFLYIQKTNIIFPSPLKFNKKHYFFLCLSPTPNKGFINHIYFLMYL